MIALFLGAVSVGNAQIDDYMAAGELAYQRSDIVAAMSWFRKAAELGDPEAQLRLGRILDRAEQNEEAVDWFRKAAEQGFAAAQYELGTSYVEGEGVTKDLLIAVSWIARAAESNHEPAIRTLATAFERGQLGLAADHAKVIRWLEKGVSIGDAWSIRKLASAYESGALGLAVNPGRAAALSGKLDALSN